MPARRREVAAGRSGSPGKRGCGGCAGHWRAARGAAIVRRVALSPEDVPSRRPRPPLRAAAVLVVAAGVGVLALLVLRRGDGGGAGPGSSAFAVGSGAPADVAGSVECGEFCEKLDALGCGQCDPRVDCAVPAGGCAVSKRAQLRCQVDEASWRCTDDGHGYVIIPPPGRCVHRPASCEER